jgi:hypothetical protein
MLLAADTGNILDDIISSYEARIQSVETLFETTSQFLLGYQDSVLDTRREQERINHQLRDSLAQNGSLRKKDFDTMISFISSQQDRQEREVRTLSKDYLSEQTNLVHELREGLQHFRNGLAKGEAERINEFQTAVKELLTKQEKRRQEVVLKLKEFQKEQEETARMLKDLLARGRELRIGDLKSLLAQFKRQHEERTARRKERREEVQSMLGDFRKGRLEVAQRGGRI